MVNAVKWVDEVIPDAPYAITEDFMRKLFDEYNIDYIIHGDDPCVLPDGTDAYALAKKAGRYKQIKRTEGVSSTDIVGWYLTAMLEGLFLNRLHSVSLLRMILLLVELPLAWFVYFIEKCNNNKYNREFHLLCKLAKDKVAL